MSESKYDVEPVRRHIEELLRLSDSQPQYRAALSPEETSHQAARLKVTSAGQHFRSPFSLPMHPIHKPLDVESVDRPLNEFPEAQRQSPDSPSCAEPRQRQAAPAPLPAGREIENDETGQGEDLTVTLLTEPPDLHYELKEETEAYHDLVNDGGRPLYPLDLLPAVLDDAERYRTMLRPFWKHPSSDFYPECIFQQQRERWKGFRNWQLDNRGLEEADDGFEAYVNRLRKEFTRCPQLLARLNEDPSWLKAPGSCWDMQLKKRAWQRCWQRERLLGDASHCKALADYRLAAHARLKKHGYINLDLDDPRLELRLEEDPKRQDVITTWMEYLCFECWWQGRWERLLQRLQPERDAAWARLRQTRLFERRETAQLIRSDRWNWRQRAGLELARQGVFAAQERLETARRRMAFLEESDGREAAQATLENAADRVKRAKARCKREVRRGKAADAYIAETADYHRTEEDLAKQLVLVEWAARQVPVVRREMRRPLKDVSGHEPITRKRVYCNDDEDGGDDGDAATREAKRRKTSSDGRYQAHYSHRPRQVMRHCSNTSRHMPEKYRKTRPGQVGQHPS